MENICCCVTLTRCGSERGIKICERTGHTTRHPSSLQVLHAWPHSAVYSSSGHRFSRITSTVANLLKLAVVASCCPFNFQVTEIAEHALEVFLSGSFWSCAGESQTRPRGAHSIHFAARGYAIWELGTRNQLTLEPTNRQNLYLSLWPWQSQPTLQRKLWADGQAGPELTSKDSASASWS